MKKKTKLIPFALVAVLATSPFLTAVPKAYALTFDDISASDYGTDEEADYEFTIDIGSKLTKGDTITITFPDEFELDEDGDTSDISVDGYAPKKVSVDDDDKEIVITLNRDVPKGEIDIYVDNIVTNPEDADSYSVKIKTSSESAKSKTIKIKDGGSSSSSKSFDLTVSGKYTEDKTKITLGEFTLSDKLVESDYVYVTFPTDDMLPSTIDESDVEINGEEPKSVSVVKSSNQVKIQVPKKAAGTKDLEIIFYDTAKITLPSKAKSSYYFKLKYKSTTYESESFEVKSGSGSSSSSSDFTVKLADTNPGARSSYNFSLDLGKEKLSGGGSIEIEFPSADMIPPILSASSVSINGEKVSSATSYGSKIYLKTASNFKSSSTINVIFDYDAYITNPKIPGSDYVLVARTGSQNIKSQKFTISGAVVTNPTTPTTPTTPETPVVANNSTATVGLTKSALNTTTGINIGIKAFGLPVAANTDFIEVVLPVGFRVPTILNAAAIKVNGVQPSYVASRGQNLLIYPAQNLPVNAPVSLLIAESAGIATPATKNVYSIGVYTSKEKNLLFARPVSVGGAVIPPTQQPQTQQPQVPSTIPASAARVKLNVASFTLNNKTYPLSVAPYTLNGNTLVPAQFFKEALSLTTQWNNTTCAIISGTTVIKFTVGSNKAKVGSTEVTLPVAVQLKNGMPMLPIRMIADNLKYNTGWDSATSSVYIYK